MDIDEESVEPPVHDQQSQGDLIAAEKLDEVLVLTRAETNVDHRGDGEGSVES